MRHTLYAHVQGIADRKQRSWLNMLLYGIHEEDVSYFLTSSGLHIATLAACLQKLLLMICSQANASVIALLLLGLCGHVTVFSSSLIRILLFRLVTLCCHSRNPQDRLAAVSRFPLCLCVFVCGLSAECAMFLWCIVCVYNTACRPAGCASAVRDNAVLYSTAALALSMGEGSCVLYQLCTEKAAGCFVSSIFVCALFFVV